jgi:hypothetical protein
LIHCSISSPKKAHAVALRNRKVGFDCEKKLADEPQVPQQIDHAARNEQENVGTSVIIIAAERSE